MGSTGWVRCYHCWSWAYDVHLADWAPKPLENGLRSWYQPDNLARMSTCLSKLIFEKKGLNEEIVENICSYVVEYYIP